MEKHPHRNNKPLPSNKRGFQASIDEIIPGFFICSAFEAGNLNMLKGKHISHILVCGSNLTFKFPKFFEYKKQELMDLPQVSIIKCLVDGFHYIEAFLNETELYGSMIDLEMGEPKIKDLSPEKLNEDKKLRSGLCVHCMAGCSRSVSTLCAFLMLKLNVSFEEMIAHIKTSRKQARPNKGFAAQLEQYDNVVKAYHKEKNYCEWGGLEEKLKKPELKRLLSTKIDFYTLNLLLSEKLDTYLKPQKYLSDQYKNIDKPKK